MAGTWAKAAVATRRYQRDRVAEAVNRIIERETPEEGPHSMTDLKAAAADRAARLRAACKGADFLEMPVEDVIAILDERAALYAERDEARQEVADLRKDQGYIIGWNDGWDEAFGRLKFPTMLRKMWSGGEVQRWLDERKAEQTSPPAGSLSERLTAAEASLASYKEEVERLRGALESICEYWNGAPESAIDAIQEVEQRAAEALTKEPPHAE